MKKFLGVFLAFILSLTACFFIGCKKEETLMPLVSQLRSNLYSGQSQSYKLTAEYGYKEDPFVNDGKVGEKVYRLTLKLASENANNLSLVAFLTANNTDYKGSFQLNPANNIYTVSFEIENFTQNEFSVDLMNGSKKETALLTSILPKGTLNANSALKAFKNSQQNLLDGYKNNDGEYAVEIYARVIIKNEKPYWYIGLASGENKLKALLIDGFSGEVLAIRDVF